MLPSGRRTLMLDFLLVAGRAILEWRKCPVAPESTTKVGEGGMTVDACVTGIVKGWLLNLLLPSSQLLGLPSGLPPIVLSRVASRQ